MDFDRFARGVWETPTAPAEPPVHAIVTAYRGACERGVDPRALLARVLRMIRIVRAMDSILAWGRVGRFDEALAARGAYDAPLIGSIRAGRLDLLESGGSWDVGPAPATRVDRTIRVFGAARRARAFSARC
jgi:hypothetical protein